MSVIPSGIWRDIIMEEIMAGKREQQMKEITERLEQGVKELFTSEMYTEYLKTMSQFHNYSFNNTVLIAMQKPDATLVAGYQAWQKKFKRQVKKGEKGIQIIAPAPIREKEEIEKFDPETNEPILRPDGQPETEEVVHTIPRFRIATVFDVSQTYGEPLPELETPELMGNVENYEIFMQALRDISPVPIRFDEIESGAKGYYSTVNKETVIQQGMSEMQTMKTGIHETTHAKLHDREIMEELGEKKNQMTREVEAESVAYTVCQYFGLDTSDYSFPYIAGWSSSVEMEELRASMDTIRKTAGEMIDGMMEVMQQLMREQPEKEKLEENIELVENQEKYQEVELFDVPGLFANGRVDQALLPPGIYRYELRGSDYDPGYPLTVENHVTVNHAATVLTAIPINLSRQGRLWLGEELNFIGGEQTISEYQQMMAGRTVSVEQEKAESAIGRANESLALSGQEDRYAIYQIVGATKGRDYRFMGMDFVTSHDMRVDAADYGYVYGGRLSGEETLDSLYEKFNINHPAGYEGHSLSVSDVIVLQKDGKVEAYYVDSIGFQKLPGFVQQRLHEVEMDRKRWYAPVTLDSSAVDVEQHEGYWHPVERLEAADEVFYLMKHNEYGDSVAAVIVNSEGDLVAQDLEKGIDRGAIETVKEYLTEKGIEWEPGEQELEKWGIKAEMQKGSGETELTQKQYPPVYQHTLTYAVEHAAADEYLDSRKLNIDCKKAVEEAIDNHFDGMHLDSDVVEPVLKKYGQERLTYVLACTLQYKLWDGRFSRENKTWAENISVEENVNRGVDANTDYVVDSHPAVLDGFVSLARKKFAELEKEQSKENVTLMAEDITNFKEISRDYSSVSRIATYVFSCEVDGVPDTLTYEVSQHDDGEGFTIHTEKNDIWDRMQERELEKLEMVLSREVVYARYQRDVQDAENHEALKEIEWGIMDTENLNLSREQLESIYSMMEEKEKIFLNQGQPFVARYYVVNDVYGVKVEREYQYFEDIGGALTAYSELPNHLDKQLGMESTEMPPSRMPLINCKNGIEDMEDIAFDALSGKWVNDEVTDAYNRAQFYLDNRDTDIVYELPADKGYFYIQTTAEGWYDYTFYDKEYRELDGGAYENPDISIQEAVEELLAEEQIHFENCHVTNWDEFMDKVAEAGKQELEERAGMFTEKSVVLTGEQADVLDKIACASGMDGWFSIGEDNTYIYDFENNERLSLEEGIQTLYEGMTSYQDYEMTAAEISVFEGLLNKLQIEVIKEELPLTSGVTEPEKALGGMSRAEIEETVLCYAQAQLEDMGLAEEVKLNAARVYGSRTRAGLYNNASDVDVALSYSGNIREDDFFSALHKAGMAIAGLPLDINPVSTEKTGTLQEYLKQAEKYLDDKELLQLAYDIDQFSSEYDLYQYRDSVDDREENVNMIYSELVSRDAESIRKWVAKIAADENDDPPKVVEEAKKMMARIEQAQKMGRAEIVHEPEKADAKITFYVAECMEFPILGEYQDNLTLKEAVQKYEEIPADRINGIKGIGFRLEDGSMYDGDYELMSAGVISKDLIDLVPHYKESPLVQQAVADLEQMLSDRRQEKITEKPQEKQTQKEKEQAQEPQISADKGKAASVPETAPEQEKQPETIPGKDNYVAEGTGRKQSVLKALRERQAKLKQEQKSTEQKAQNHKKGEQEL